MGKKLAAFMGLAALGGLFYLGQNYKSEEHIRSPRVISTPAPSPTPDPDLVLRELIEKRDADRAATFVSQHRNESFIFNYRIELTKLFSDALSAAGVSYAGHRCNPQGQLPYAHAYRIINPENAASESYSLEGMECIRPGSPTLRILRGE